MTQGWAQGTLGSMTEYERGYQAALDLLESELAAWTAAYGECDWLTSALGAARTNGGVDALSLAVTALRCNKLVSRNTLDC